MTTPVPLNPRVETALNNLSRIKIGDNFITYNEISSYRYPSNQKVSYPSINIKIKKNFPFLSPKEDPKFAQMINYAYLNSDASQLNFCIREAYLYNGLIGVLKELLWQLGNALCMKLFWGPSRINTARDVAIIRLTDKITEVFENPSPERNLIYASQTKTANNIAVEIFNVLKNNTFQITPLTETKTIFIVNMVYSQEDICSPPPPQEKAQKEQSLKNLAHIFLNVTNAT